MHFSRLQFVFTLNDGSYIMLENGTEILYGEAYLIKDGQQQQICKDGDSIWIKK